MPITLQHIQAAHDAIRDAVVRTPVVPAHRLSVRYGIDLSLKLENRQHTNSFKARGALNRLLALSDDQKAAGVIAVSRGNHAQGVAYQATRLGIASTIVMPEGTPFTKIKSTEDFGAEVVTHGDDMDAATAFTLKIAEDRGLTPIHPYDDPLVAAGQGTVALELMEQAPDLDAVVIPVGGGGLISGMATVIKALRPEVEVIGAQARAFDGAVAGLHGTETHFGGATLAEGIAIREPSADNLATIRAHVDRIESVTEDEIEQGVYDLLAYEKLVAEGAPGAGLAVIRNNLDALAGKKVGLVVCGGNIDSRLLSTLILRGLVRDGQIARLVFEIEDRPGQLAAISRLIGDAGANVVEVSHRRLMQSVTLKRAELEIVVEARDAEHVLALVARLRAEGFVLKMG